MKNTDNSRLKLLEFMAWLAVFVATSVAFFVTYFFHLSSPILPLVWLGWFVAVGVFFALTQQGKQVISFAKEAMIELEKVVWPSRQETIQTTSIVMIMVTVTGFILWGIDSGMMWSIGKITHLG